MSQLCWAAHEASRDAEDVRRAGGEFDQLDLLPCLHTVSRICLGTVVSTSKSSTSGLLALGYYEHHLWNMIKSKPDLDWVHRALLGFQATLPQESGVAATWENSDNWVNTCYQTLTQQLEQKDMIFNMLGVKSEEQLLSHPFMRQAKRDFGPKWRASPEGIGRVTGISKSEGQIPAAVMERGLRVRVEKIRKHWQSLQEMGQTKRLERFSAGWTQMSQSARCGDLRARFDYLHDSPDPYVYEIARASTSDWSSISAKHFKAPLLNVPELVCGENLPNFIRSRLKLHPQLFRDIDGSGTIAGLFYGSLAELSCESQLTVDRTGKDYGFQWHEQILVGSINPAVFFHQLEAQSKTYSFLSDCINGFDPTPDPMVVIGQPPSREPDLVPSSLLEQVAQIDYTEPHRIDLSFVQTLLKCSLDDQLDDLRILREDPELWNMRLSSTPQDRRCEIFLQDTFSRIDYFHGLVSLVDNLVEEDRSNPTLGSANIDKLKDYMTLEVAFRNVLDSIVATLKTGRWSRRLFNGILGGLITLLTEEHTIIWAIGHGRVLKVIQRELLDSDNCRNIPTKMMHALHDMSVIAYCLRETQKYRQLVPLGEELAHADLTEKLISKWEDHPRLWQSLASDTATLMDEQTKEKLDVLNTRETLDLAKRHEQFWWTIDSLMETASHGKDTKDVFDWILLQAPLESNLFDREAQVAPYQMAESFPSRTQVKKAKIRRPVVETPLPMSVAKGPQRTPLPRLSLSVNQTLRPEVYSFWVDLCNAEMKTTFYWNDFCKGMTGIGYSVASQWGSIYRFENRKGNRSHAIVFHRPHDGKLPSKKARRWLRRLQASVDLQISY